MSDVVWCDTGGHLFLASDPERKFWTPQNYRGDQSTPRLDQCGKHGNQVIPLPDMGAIADKMKAIEVASITKDATKDAVTKYLEWREENPNADIREFYK